MREAIIAHPRTRALMREAIIAHPRTRALMREAIRGRHQRGNHRSPTDESAVGAAVEPTRRTERASLSNAADPAASTAS